MEELIKSLSTVLRAAGDSDLVAEAATIAAWKHVAGDGLKDHALAEKLEDKTLVVVVADAIWQKQLAAMQSHLLFRINSLLGRALVSRIDFRIDSTMAVALVKEEAQPNEILDNEVPLDLWTAANAIRDKQLRQKFLRAALSLERYRNEHEAAVKEETHADQ